MLQSSSVSKIDYGIDAPGVVRGLYLGGSAALIASIFLSTSSPAPGALIWIGGAGLACLVFASSMLWSSKVGKFYMRDRLINSIDWRGDERVLDVGCGHGLLLIAAAKRLTSGQAIGVDIWSQVDQSTNRPEAAIENARIEGVADRVEVRDGDARRLPFEDKSFDVIISSLVIHNIRDLTDREQAIVEMARVLKPGGQIAIHDIAHLNEYARILRRNGIHSIKFSDKIFLFNTFTRILIAAKGS